MDIAPFDYSTTDAVGKAAIDALCRLAGIEPTDVSHIVTGDESVTFTVLATDGNGRKINEPSATVERMYP